MDGDPEAWQSPALPKTLRLVGASIRAHSPQEAVSYNVARWKNMLQSYELVSHLPEMFGGYVSRQSIFDVAAEQGRGEEPTARLWAVFTVSMMWGYGKTQRGRPYRNAPPALEWLAEHPKILPEADAALQRGALREAYVTLAQLKRHGMGESFFTKVLYFLGSAYPIDPPPLILDSILRDRLAHGTLLGMQWDAFLKSHSETKRPPPLAARYELYCRMMRDWSAELNCRPDQLEHWLFKPPDLLVWLGETLSSSRLTITPSVEGRK